MDRKPSSFVYGLSHGLCWFFVVWSMPRLYTEAWCECVVLCTVRDNIIAASLQVWSGQGRDHQGERNIFLRRKLIICHHPTSPHITSPCQWWMDSAARSSLDIYITTRCGLLLLVRCVFCSVLCTLIISTWSMCHPTNVPTVPISPVFACSELRS